MADMVDKRLFEEMAKREPEAMIDPLFCTYSEADQCYNVTAWGEQYSVYPNSGRIEMVQEHGKPHDYFYVFLVNYLLSKKNVTPVGEWISVKDLPGGVTFFRGPHEIPSLAITKSYGNDLALLKKRCEKLGGIPLDLADCSYQFDIIGNVKVALLYWQGDEDFPAEAGVLIDKSIMDTPLDVVYALLCDACMRISRPAA